MFKRLPLFLFLALFFPAGEVLGQGSLFYLEAQAVGGYSAARDRWIFYSLDQSEAMQKPSLGFDYVQRLSGETGDFAVLAIQGRLTLNASGDRTLEPQIYNAYIKFKLALADLWAGHNRPALGLGSVFDTHSHLLPALAMYDYGFDRDWGVGLGRDFARGNWAVSLTAGSGMPLRLKGNYLFSGRLGIGVLSRSNSSFGLSAAYGKTLETMGYDILSADPRPLRLVGADLSYLWNNVENRLDVMVGKKFGEDALALFWRLGINLLQEERLKWEIQPIFQKQSGEAWLNFSTGLTFLATADLTLRTMYTYDGEMKDSRLVFQAYYYKRILF